MKPKAYLLVFNGLADWEPGLAMCEINRSRRYEVVTVGFSTEPITTMGGLRIIPDISLEDLDFDRAAILVLPGGDMWEQQTDERITELLRRLHERKVPIAAICAATLAVARAGLLSETLHTSNAKEYLEVGVPEYDAADYYLDKLAVSDKGVITASGVGSVEMAYEIIKQLKLYSEEDARVWWDLFKNGIVPQPQSAEAK